ncbi:MAG: UDP-N-acetylmuramoyl-L-alanyl-D-glutamate--2,6-diaminopimelate ligase [Solirubrobacteraceae bacterium]
MIATLQALLGEGGHQHVLHLAYDSRRVRPGTLFFCVPGLERDGHDFAVDAVRRGAVALVVERPLGLGVPEIRVPDVRSAMPLVAARFHGHPSASLEVVGVTGTNGKTTTTFMLRAILEAAGRRCGLLGTVKASVGGKEMPPTLTTPEAIDLQASLRAMVDAGQDACVMEVSSHGLALRRVDQVRFVAAIFTNLTQDHLDFHETMGAYFGAKRGLLVDRPGIPVVNVDDPHGRALALQDGSVTFALDRSADFRAVSVQTSLAGSRAIVRSPAGEHELILPLPGRHNVSNALGALAAAAALGVSEEVARDAFAAFPGVPGRFERVDAGQPFAVVVDFAHTPDALAQTLATAREIADGRVICVFGCAGGRDPETRAPMGAIATELADVVVLTTDDARSERPEALVADIQRGTDGRELVIADRASAIFLAVELADEGDVVLIAGRGHERTQTVEDRIKVLDDATEARRALLQRLGAAAGR